jgi:polysaccharide export outer membrane protein
MTARFRSKNTDKGPASRVVALALLSVLVGVGGLVARAQEPAAAPAQEPAATPAEKAAAKPVEKSPEKSSAQPADKSAGKAVPREQQWTTQAPNSAAAPPDAPAGVVPPKDYIIGSEDVLSIVFWRDKDMTTDVVVRPDGKITLPLLNDVAAAGLTPDQLRDRLTEDSKRFIEDPNVSVVVKTINSRKVFITGEIAKPGPYPLAGPTTVVQLIAMAGGLKDFADGENILILRQEKDGPVSYRFSYKGLANRKVSLHTNIELKPGDTVIVP